MSRDPNLHIGLAFRDRHLQTLAGQPPYRDDSRFQAAKLESMFRKPGDLDVQKLLDREIFTARGAVQDLGLDPATESQWARFLDSITEGSMDELQARQQLFERMRVTEMDPELKKVLFQRTLSLYRNTRKSVVSVDELRKAGQRVAGERLVVLKPEQLLALSKANDKNGGKLEDRITQFLRRNPEPDDHQVHALAEKLGMEPDDLEERIYRMLGKRIKKARENKIPGGLGDRKQAKDVDPKELAMGIKVEMEHTDDPKIAREIAIDHLTENPKYYTKLRTIEPSHKSLTLWTPDELLKAKYKRRWKGPDGKWRYEYDRPKRERKGKEPPVFEQIDNLTKKYNDTWDAAFAEPEGSDTRKQLFRQLGEIHLKRARLMDRPEKKFTENTVEALKAKLDSMPIGSAIEWISSDGYADWKLWKVGPGKWDSKYDEARTTRSLLAEAREKFEINRKPRWTYSDSFHPMEFIAEKYKDQKPWGIIREELAKAEPRGGTYHRRVPYTAKSGKQKFRYFYDPEKYNQTKDAHQSGEEMSKYAMGQALLRCLERAGEKGCAPDDLKTLAKKYGGKELSKTLRERCGKGGDLAYQDGRFYVRRKEEPQK